MSNYGGRGDLKRVNRLLKGGGEFGGGVACQNSSGGGGGGGGGAGRVERLHAP